MIDISNLISVHDSGWVKEKDWLYHFFSDFSRRAATMKDRLRILAKAAELTNDGEWAAHPEWGAVAQHKGDDGTIFIIYRGSLSLDGNIRMNVLATSENYWIKSILELR